MDQTPEPETSHSTAAALPARPARASDTARTSDKDGTITASASAAATHRKCSLTHITGQGLPLDFNGLTHIARQDLPLDFNGLTHITGQGLLLDFNGLTHIARQD